MPQTGTLSCRFNSRDARVLLYSSVPLTPWSTRRTLNYNWETIARWQNAPLAIKIFAPRFSSTWMGGHISPALNVRQGWK